MVIVCKRIINIIDDGACVGGKFVGGDVHFICGKESEFLFQIKTTTKNSINIIKLKSSFSANYRM